MAKKKDSNLKLVPKGQEPVAQEEQQPQETPQQVLYGKQGEPEQQPQQEPVSQEIYKPQTKVITEKEIAEATEMLKKYKTGKTNLENRIKENEQWWKLRHWEYIRNQKQGGENVEPTSAWLFNSLANKHADAMDNYPEPNVLPRAQDDKSTATTLSSILPVVLEQNEYEQVYSDVWWYKLKQGTGVKGIFWNSSKNNGLGDIDIKKIDLLNLFWKPGITDIQDSPNLFSVDIISNKVLNNTYGLELQGTSSIDVAKYLYDDTVDTMDSSVVVDWYYKKKVVIDQTLGTTRDVLHYCKYVGTNVLYSSENDAEYSQQGYYDHGKYPFVFDTLFPEEGTPAGFGYIDIMKSCQEYIDKLGGSILQNSIVSSKKRYFVRDDGGVNEKEFADISKDLVHVTGNLGEDTLREIPNSGLSGNFVTVLQNKVEELKETSGNRDFSQGSVANGVTAASAISALQEAGSKLSRDMLKSAYRSFSQECYFVIELMRQFYDAPRCFRITGANNNMDFESFDNRGLQPKAQGTDFGIDLGSRLPIFDIEVVAAKKSTYSRIAQNELALQFFDKGFFNPQITDQALACLDMMDFDGKESIIQKIQMNGTLAQELAQAQKMNIQLAQMIDMEKGSNMAEMVATGVTGSGSNQPMPKGGTQQTKMGSMADQAKEKAQQSASVR